MKPGKVLLVVFVIITVLGLGGLSWWTYLRSTPEYAVYRTLSAIKNQDAAVFNNFCDFEAVADWAYQDTVSKIIRENSPDGEGYRSLAVAEFLDLLEPRIKELVVEPLVVKKRAGSLWEADRYLDGSVAGVVGLFREIKVARDGERAKVFLGDQTFSLDSKVGGWQVVSAAVPAPAASVRERVLLNFGELKRKLKVTSPAPRREVIEKDIGKLAAAIEAYYTGNSGRYPHGLTELAGQYLEVLPYAPGGDEYGYRAYRSNKECLPDQECREAAIFYNAGQDGTASTAYCYQTATGVVFLEVPAGHCDASPHNDTLR